MTTSAAKGRPRTHADGPAHHGHDHMTTPTVAVENRDHEDALMVSPAPDIVDYIRTATRLARLLEEQQRAERVAYERGWSAGYTCARTEGEATR